jgi:hypothetical protein
MVYFMPNLSNPRPANWETLPILLFDYQATQSGVDKHQGLGLKATSFQTVEMQAGPLRPRAAEMPRTPGRLKFAEL